MTGAEELAAVAAVAAVAAAGVTAYSAVQQGKAASDAANYNAKLAAQNAAIAQQQAQSQATQQQAQARAKIGAAEAAYGASGVDAGSGSPLDVLSSSAQQSEFGRQTILYNGNLKALGYNDQTQLDNAAAGNALAQGDLKAGSAVLTGAAGAAGKFGGSGAGTSPGLSANEIGTLQSTSPGEL